MFETAIEALIDVVKAIIIIVTGGAVFLLVAEKLIKKIKE